MPRGSSRRARIRLAAGPAVGLLIALAAPLAVTAPAGAAPADLRFDCSVKAGGSPGIAWAQQRLDLAAAASVADGTGVKVAVIDSGLYQQPGSPLAGIRIAAPTSEVPGSPGVTDCVGHGTEVTAIIAGQPGSSGFVGVAPGATIMPIKQTSTEQEQSGGADRIARGIEAAIRAHARVINISVTTTAPGALLPTAMADAARAGVVIVAAAGNDTPSSSAAQTIYPAGYSLRYRNVIAVSAVMKNDQPAPFSLTGHYVSIAAPGAAVEVPAPRGGFTLQNGTSFATPFVTGTVALLLQKYPRMSATDVRARLESTADLPPTSVPDPKYGWGIVNPYLALTSLRTDSGASPRPAAVKPLPAPVPPRTPDRHTAHVALAVGLGLLGAAVLAAVAAAVVRSDRRDRTRIPAQVR